MLIQITSPYFCAGVILSDDHVTQAAPIVKYMRGWHLSRVNRYCQSKGWEWRIISTC